MSLPGPSGLTWALELLLFAAAFLPAGELFRYLAAPWVSLFRDLGLLERLLLDLYLGGGGLYLLALVPLGWFSLPVVLAYLGTPVAILGLLALLRRRSAGPRSDHHGTVPSISSWLPVLAVLAASAAVFAIEVYVAEGVPTGNSYDTSLLADYVALLLLHHQVPLTLAPIAPQFTSYPQGTTVWLGAAQLIFSLPPARTPLLVTPLFLSLSPIAGSVLGRRLLGSPWAGAVLGLMFALIGTWTRVMVATSNDFVFSFPLVLWLLARIDLWRGAHPPSWPNALAYGAVLGYSAGLNPVGAEWLFPSIVVLGLFAGRFRAAFLKPALLRWAGSLGVALLFVTPALWTILKGGGAPSALSGPATVPSTGAFPSSSPAQFVGYVDPFLFGPHAVWLSPFVALRFELALLLVAGAALLVVPSLFRHLGPPGPALRPLVGGLIGVALAILFIEVGAYAGLSFFGGLDRITSAPEVSIYLFTVYLLLAALPLYLLVEYARHPDTGATSPASPAIADGIGRPHSRRPGWPASRVIVLALAVALLVPGVVVTGTDFPPYLQQLYGSYGRVTPADFALFSWATHGFPVGARVLVAPGSAAQFLPAYANLQLVYPVQGIAQNASYVDLDRQLVHGHLNASGFQDLIVLRIQYIVVTGNTTDLWAPFDPAALQGPPFGLVYQNGDAYVFSVPPNVHPAGSEELV